MAASAPAVAWEEEYVRSEEEASSEAAVEWEEGFSAVASLLEVEGCAAPEVATSWRGVDPPLCGDVSQPRRSNLQV